MSEHEQQIPVTITDKRGQRTAPDPVTAAEQASLEADLGLEEGHEDRLQRIRQALVDGKRSSLSPEDMEFFMANQEDVAEPSNQQSVRCMFLVVVRDDGTVFASPHLADAEQYTVPEGTMASGDDIYSAACMIQRDINAVVTAQHSMAMMMQQAQEVARKQAGLQAANGFNPNGVRRG